LLACLLVCLLACSCTLNPAVRETFSGHAEFDVLLEAVSESKGEQQQQRLIRCFTTSQQLFAG
jgi:hypothetical protein